MNFRVILAAGAIAGCAVSSHVSTGRPQRSARPFAPSRTLPASGLEFAVDPPAAEIFVDGQRRGTVDDLVSSGGVLALPPGIYQVSLKAKGRVTWRAEVAVGSSREKIEVKLLPR